MPTCPECGTPNQRGSCAHCGASLAGGQQPEQSGTGQPGRQNEQTATGQPPAHGGAEQSQPGTQAGVSADASAQAGAAEARISRRKLLAGGAGAVALAGGGWYFFLRGPSGAKAVATDYVDALANNDWAAMEQIFHEQSEPMQAIASSDDMDGYEGYLARQGLRERAEEITPSVTELTEWKHLDTVEDETAAELSIGLNQEDAAIVEQAKDVIAVVEDNAATVYDEDAREQYVAGDSTNVPMTLTIISDGDGWRLWNGGRVY